MNNETAVRPILRLLPLLIVVGMRLIGFINGIIQTFTLEFYTFTQYMSDMFNPITLLFSVPLFLFPVLWLIGSGKRRSKGFLIFVGIFTILTIIASIIVSIIMTNAYHTMVATGEVPEIYPTMISFIAFIPGSSMIWLFAQGYWSGAIFSGITLLNMLFIAILSFRFSKISGQRPQMLDSTMSEPIPHT